MKIGILGGSFNPPHKMHLEIGLNLINRQYVDKVIYVPTGSKYKYKNNLLPNKNRLDMLKLITDKYDYLSVSDYELKSEVIYTYQTLKHFKEMNPNDEIYFICGTDNLSYMNKWMNSEEILSNYKILVVRRNNENVDNLLDKFGKYRKNIVVADVEQSDISSTDIREKIKNKENVLDVLDKDVYEYIKKNKLYEMEKKI